VSGQSRPRTEVGFCVPLFAYTGASFFRTPAWTRLDPATAVEASLLADRLGYDSLWVADHLLHGHDGGILEGWSTLAYLAGATRQIRLGTIHLAHQLRPPALTAKMAATLDALSNGRLIFFYDVGGGQPESGAYGYDVPLMAERVARMDEGLDLIRRLWTSLEPISYAGTYYRTDNAVCRPGPVQRPTPPIWLGEIREDPWCDLVWRHGSGWNSTPVSVADYQARLARLAAAGNRVGRDLSELELSLEIEILVAPNRAAVRQLADEIAALPAPTGRTREDLVTFLRTSDPARDWRLPASYEERTLVGTPDEVIDRLREYQQLGVRHFMLWFLDFPSTRGIELVAEKVLPAVRGRSE
jgi:alkanesulfonate monooxygenase SsuD/methylene tetrahydromethanopterin reductase-like flavin-dependent oxidoreductase (luciferase family)